MGGTTNCRVWWNLQAEPGSSLYQGKHDRLRSDQAVSKNPHGIFCVDLKGDESGVPCPTEINCRFTTNVHYLTLASLKLGHPEWNFPWLVAKICLGEKIPPTKAFNALPANLWFTKNTDMGFTMVVDGKWRAEDYS